MTQIVMSTSFVPMKTKEKMKYSKQCQYHICNINTKILHSKLVSVTFQLMFVICTIVTELHLNVSLVPMSDKYCQCNIISPYHLNRSVYCCDVVSICLHLPGKSASTTTGSSGEVTSETVKTGCYLMTSQIWKTSENLAK